MRRLSRVTGYLTDSPTRIVLSACVSFVVAAVLKFLIVSLLLELQVPRIYLRAQDALLTGALAASFVAALMYAFASRRKHIQDQIRAIADLNHEVRNALEVIIGSGYLPRSQQADAIMESVERINRSLKSVLGDPATTSQQLR